MSYDLTAIKALIEAHYRPEEYPACWAQRACWSATRPLEGLRVLDATPVFRNTLTKYLALLEAGAELSVGIASVMPYDPEILELVKRSGIEVYTPETAPQGVDLVLDCAAQFLTVEARLGYVELTRSGVEPYRNCPKPVFVADSSRIKRIETCLGTGESYFRAMSELGYTQWSGRKLLLFGSGKVGYGIMHYAIRLGAEVVVVSDLSALSESVRALGVRVIDFREGEAVARELSDAYAVVTATGVVGAATAYCSAEHFIQSPALLANMGVEDEYGEGVLASRVLEGKKPINFLLDEPTHLKYIDATMALHNAGALYLTTQAPQRGGLLEPPQQIEQELLAVSAQNGVISSELELI